MEALLILLLLYLAVVLLVLPIWAIVKIRNHDSEVDALQSRIRYLEQDIKKLRAGAAESPPAPVPAPAPPPPASEPPVILGEPAGEPPPIPTSVTGPTLASGDAVPPLLLEPSVATREMSPPASEPPARFNWEQFMGAKLFAWLGGLALFLGIAFFVKYSFEHGWIPPEVRVGLGFLLGAGLIVGGLRIRQDRYPVTAQTLIATGVVSLYAVTFACNAIYHFAFFGTIPTFLLMALITAAAFMLAIRLEAPVIAVLGVLGGFLTPVLLSTGRDNALGLFGYVALLNAGLAAIALHRRWLYLVPLGAGGTFLMMLGWADRHYQAAKTPAAMAICLTFCALFLAVHLVAKRLRLTDWQTAVPAAAMPLIAFGFALFFLDFPAAAERAALWMGFVMLADAALLLLAWKDEDLPKVHVVSGIVAFLLLGVWTIRFLTDETLPTALAFYLLLGGLHTAFPMLLERIRPGAAPAWWTQVFAPLALVLMLLPLFKLDEVSLLLWPAILILDLIAIAVAAMSASMLAVIAALVLTLVATAAWLLNVPATLTLAPSLAVVIGGFAILFAVAGIRLAGRFGGGEKTSGGGKEPEEIFGGANAQLPALSSLLPFLLLVLVCARLSVPDPSMVFGLTLLLVALSIGLSRILAAAWLPACALAGAVVVQYAWQARHFDPGHATVPLLWHLGFMGVFAAFPFAFLKRFSSTTGPWATAALAGVAHFPLVHTLIERSAPNAVMGLFPAMFAVPPLISLFAILKLVSPDEPKRINQLAWFGGAALFFATLIFPIQFDRQWITVGWALEGVALLWLFHRVPHPGLRGVGVALLAVSFVRLALNDAVLSYHPRGDTPILNWYLYAYGIVAASLFAGARLLAPPRERALGLNAQALLNALGTILAFILLNIEIADFFTPAGRETLTFQFSGNFARDMTYTIAWSLFALGLLAAGIWTRQRAARFAAIGLLGAAMLKLFLHDLARLEALYRIGALLAVAVVAIVASFAYQRFLPSTDKEPAPHA